MIGLYPKRRAPVAPVAPVGDAGATVAPSRQTACDLVKIGCEPPGKSVK
jgi:hypothetical protein